MNGDYIPKDLLDDDIVFHYTSANTAIQYILHEKRLRLSPRKKSIDPVERFNFTSRLTSSLEDEDYKEVETTGNRIVNTAKDKVSKCKQICFCMSKQDVRMYKEGDDLESFGFLKPRMWDQYAVAYSGFCLAFSKDVLLNNANSGFLGKEIDYVTYATMQKNILWFDYDDLFKRGEEECAKEYNDKVMLNLFRKHKDYEGENEFRICSFTNEFYDSLSIEKALKAIIVSPQFLNDYTENFLYNYCVKENVSLVYIHWQNEGFRLSLPIEDYGIRKKIQESFIK